MKIEQAIYISKANLMFSVCPRCHKAIEREYTNHCSSCGQKLLWQDIDNIKIVYPPNNLISKYRDIADNLINKICENKVEIMELLELRDSLLPKLMSGEIKVN